MRKAQIQAQLLDGYTTRMCPSEGCALIWKWLFFGFHQIMQHPDWASTPLLDSLPAFHQYPPGSLFSCALNESALFVSLHHSRSFIQWWILHTTCTGRSAHCFGWSNSVELMCIHRHVPLIIDFIMHPQHRIITITTQSRSLQKQCQEGYEDNCQDRQTPTGGVLHLHLIHWYVSFFSHLFILLNSLQMGQKGLRSLSGKQTP